jgi:hypothetical protein
MEPGHYSRRVSRGLPALWRTNRFRIAARELERLGVADRVLVDFGCADGVAIPIWAGLARQVIGVDNDEGRLEHARRVYGSMSNVRFVRSADYEFDGDVMVALDVFEHMPNVDDAISVLRRFLHVPGRTVFASLPLEVGIPRILKLVASRLHPSLCVLHGPHGYDYRPLLRAITSDQSLELTQVRFEPFAALGRVVNRGLWLNIRGARPTAQAG